MESETTSAVGDCEEALAASDRNLCLDHDEDCVVEILDEANGNVCLSYAEVGEFVTDRDFDEKEYRCRGMGSPPDVLIEKDEEERLCGVRKPDQYLHLVYLCGPGDPCCDFSCGEMEYIDRCGSAKDCVFSCVCEG
jgi:hypothetical protein